MLGSYTAAIFGSFSHSPRSINVCKCSGKLSHERQVWKHICWWNQMHQRVKLETGTNQNLESWTEQLPPFHSSRIQSCTQALQQQAVAKQNTWAENGKAAYHNGLSMTSAWQTFSAASKQNGFQMALRNNLRKGTYSKGKWKMQKMWRGLGWPCDIWDV